MAGVSPKTAESIAQGGGRHYKGRGLGVAQGFKCVACGAENAGLLIAGCVSCGAGKPGVTHKREPAPAAPAERAGGPGVPTRQLPLLPRGGSAGSLSEQLRQRSKLVAIDYDEIERRVERALETRLGSGYSTHERITIYNALECYITLWDEGSIEPTGGLNIEQTRALALKVAPEEGLETDGNATSTSPPAGSSSDEYDDRDPNTRGYEWGEPSDGDPGPGDPDPSDTLPAVHRVGAAPEFIDPDPGGDESGQDDPPGDGS